MTEASHQRLPLIDSSRRRALMTVGLSGLAVLGNHFNLPLFFGVDFIFGSVAVLLALSLLGWRPAVIVAAVGGAYTILLWGHPYALLILVLEPLAVAVLQRRFGQLALADALYWILLGMPLVFFIYTGVLGMDWIQSGLVVIKQALNGIFNAVIACILMMGLLSARNHGMPTRVPIADLLFNTLLAVTLLAGMLPVVLDSRSERLDLETEIDARLGRVGSRIVAHMEKLSTANLNGTEIPAEMSAALVAADGRILAARGTVHSLHEAGTLTTASGGAQIWLPGGEMAAMQRWRNGHYVRDIPLTMTGSVVRLVIEQAAAPLVARIEQQRLEKMSLLAVLTLFAVVLAALLSRWMTRSIRQLDTLSQDLSARIAAGAPTSISGSRIAEYDSLAASIRAMAESLSVSFREVRDMHDTLEQRVQERTAKLARRETMLAESEARFRNMADAAPALIWLSDTENLATWYNTRWLKYTGRSLEQELGLGWAAGVHSDDLDRCVAYCNEAFAARQAFEMEFRLRRADGSYGWIVDTGIPRFNADGDFEGYIGYCWDITDRKEAEFALERLSRVASQTTNGVIITDTEGCVEWINEGFTRISGYGLDELRGRKPGPILQGPDTDPATVAHISDALHRREPFLAELINYSKTGTPYWIRINCNPLLDAAGRIQGFMAIQSDVTEEIKTAERIRDSERRLAAVIEGTHIGTWEWNVQTGATVFNARWAEIVGYTLEELAPISIQTWLDLAHPDDLKYSGALLEQHFAGELAYYDAECRMRHKDGHWVWVHDRGRVITWTTDGKPLLMSGTHADISEHKNAEAALRASEAQYRSLVVNIPGAAYQCAMDENWTVLYISEAIEALTGYPATDFIGNAVRSYASVIHPEDTLLGNQAMLDAISADEPWTIEYRICHRDGSVRWVFEKGRAMRDENGDIVCLSGFLHDITERKRMERMKDEFVSTVSHELRTPLTSISGALGLLAGGAIGELPAQARQMLDIAHKNSQRLTHLINDLLDMEKLVAGKLRFDLQVQELMPLVEQAMEAIRAYGVQYEVRFELVERADAVQVRVDAIRLQQVLSNFLSNAAKFSPRGGQVEIVVRQRDGRVRIEVVDHGPGIPMEFRDRIFQKFSQADASNTRQKGGTGLGLAISKELVECMDGTVGFVSEAGQGAHFYCELPVWESHGVPQGTQRTSTSGGPTAILEPQ